MDAKTADTAQQDSTLTAGSANPLHAQHDSGGWLSPINQRRWNNFKANGRGYWSLWIFLILFILSLFAEFIANDKPLLIKYDGGYYMPVFNFYAETDFGGAFQTEAIYRDPEVQCLIDSGGLEDCFDDPEGIIEQIDAGTFQAEGFERGWSLWPLIRSFHRHPVHTVSILLHIAVEKVARRKLSDATLLFATDGKVLGVSKAEKLSTCFCWRQRHLDNGARPWGSRLPLRLNWPSLVEARQIRLRPRLFALFPVTWRGVRWAKSASSPPV